MDISRNNIGSPVISIVLNLHTPFSGFLRKSGKPDSYTWLEQCFFEELSETYIPMLEMFDRLDKDRVPFRFGISISPVLCKMLGDQALIGKYIDYTDKQIEFGSHELKNIHKNDGNYSVIKHFYDQIEEKRIVFTEHYGSNIINVLSHYQQKGRLEILGTAATHAFLPFYSSHPGALQAEIETALGVYRKYFDKYPQGFWLPEFGWTEELDSWLRSYNFAYTMVESHGLCFASPAAEKGTFFPVTTASGVFVLGRDYYACSEIESMHNDPCYRDNRKDLGFELSAERLSAILDSEGGRFATGFKCKNRGEELYDPGAASLRAEKHAEQFLENRIKSLGSAFSMLNSNCTPISLCAVEAGNLGRRWHEGFKFLESFIRKTAASNNAPGGIQMMSPADYLFRLDSCSFQVVSPEFSSSGGNGYAETWVHSSSDWMYRHTMRALDRMVEIAERFPDDTGLKERVLNQAAREILLLLASDWPKMLYRQECAEYAKNQIESFLRSFTTIYEALGSNNISTEWLTRLEKAHNIFPNINYRIFRKKRNLANGGKT